MLHNSGPFGPNDVPINMGAPVNMTQISSSTNLGNSMSNLPKMSQQTPQASVPHYSAPDYSPFSNSPLNMGHSMNPFMNYHSLNFQSNFGHPNAILTPDTVSHNSQNGMLPMNLNIQSDQSSNLMNYQGFDSKIMDLNTPPYRENFSRKMPINIPQIHTKAFHKQLGMESNYAQYNAIQDGTSYSQNLSKTPEKTLLDSNRRKSLENTVKLIENILINNTSKDKLKNMENQSKNDPKAATPVTEVDKEISKSEITRTEIQNSHPNQINKTSTLKSMLESPKADMINSNNSFKNKLNHNSILFETLSAKKESSANDKNNMKSDNVTNFMDSAIMDMRNAGMDSTKTDSNETNSKLQTEIHCTPLKRSLLNNKTEPERLKRDVEEEISDNELLEKEIKQEQIEEDAAIKVKVEPIATWTDVDNAQPFLKDCNAIDREDIEADAILVDGDNNVSEATEAAKNGITQKTYYECSHCGLIFKHPKRFLIHTKWHSFGLTNEKREELLREKEMRKTMKREARIIQRLNNKEVKAKEAEGTVHPCKDCDKVFKVKSSLKNHRQRYHPTRVRECKICNATVIGWMALREHLNAHAGGGQGYQCNECPKRFKYSHSLAKHKDTHLEKTHGCEQCEKKFGSQTLLKMHMKCHERAARGTTFRCTYCGKGFFENYNLQVHERTHRNERPFLCEICNTSFGTNSSLKRHLKVSHSSSKQFPCAVCQRCFISAGTRARHTARVHGDPKEFSRECALCPRRYRNDRDLNKHMCKAHPKAAKYDGEQDV